MPKIIAPMSDEEIRSIQKDGVYAVGGAPGLMVQVRGNARSWILRVVIEGKRRDLGLGGLSDLSADEARVIAKQKRSEPLKAPAKPEKTAAPWVRLARTDLEATSAVFALEFANRLYPKLIKANTMEQQLAAFRAAFVETVEAP